MEKNTRLGRETVYCLDYPWFEDFTLFRLLLTLFQSTSERRSKISVRAIEFQEFTKNEFTIR